jgi:hypothetical protein
VSRWRVKSFSAEMAENWCSMATRLTSMPLEPVESTGAEWGRIADMPPTTPSSHDGPSGKPFPLSLTARVLLLTRIWGTFALVGAGVRRAGLAATVDRLADLSDTPKYPVELLSHAVTRGLRVGPWRPRCLYRSLVLYALLRKQGESAELVIGLRPSARTPDAHAWVEIGGRDVGPWPGMWGAVELTRLPGRIVGDGGQTDA